MKQSQFDKLVEYTLRVELLNGRVLVYNISTETKQYLINKLKAKAEGDEEVAELRFLWYQTPANRMVIINIDELARVTFCFDYTVHLREPNTYYDNFDLLEKDTLIEEKESKEVERRLHVLENTYLPQAIIYHKGKAPDDLYDKNPLTYSELEEGCLSGFEMELDGEWQLRQFINLIDNDGEETFIPLKQIIVMELDSNLFNANGFEDMDRLEEDGEDE